MTDCAPGFEGFADFVPTNRFFGLAAVDGCLGGRGDCAIVQRYQGFIERDFE